MKTASPRPEHVIAAAWAAEYMARHEVGVAEVRANGVAIANPIDQATDLRGRMALEPRKGSFVAWCLRPIMRAKAWAIGLVKKPAPPEQLQLRGPSTPWQPENVRDSVRVELALADGRAASVEVPFVRRDETLSLLAISSAVTAAAVIPIPGFGNLALIPGALLCGARATGAYLTGNVAGGNANALTALKMVGLGLIDFIPVVANATFTATLLRAQDASERYRVGDGLIDTRRAEEALRPFVREPLQIECAGKSPLPSLLPSLPVPISSGY